MAFKDFAEFAKPPLDLPYNGKLYRIPTPDVELGLRLTRGLNGDTEELTSADIGDQWALVLGPAYDEMRADKVPAVFVARAFVTALADFQLGREMAEITWEVGSDPEAVRAYFEANRETEEQTEGAPEPGSTSTAEATSTP